MARKGQGDGGSARDISDVLGALQSHQMSGIFATMLAQPYFGTDLSRNCLERANTGQLLINMDGFCAHARPEDWKELRDLAGTIHAGYVTTLLETIGGVSSSYQLVEFTTDQGTAMLPMRDCIVGMTNGTYTRTAQPVK